MAIVIRRYVDVVAQHQAAAEAARSQAERDIAEGRLQFIYCSPLHWYTPQDWAGEYNRLLKERFSVDPTVSVNSPYSDPDDRYVFECEYGWRMRSEIERRFGEGILQAVEAEAKQLFSAEMEANAGGGGCRTKHST